MRQAGIATTEQVDYPVPAFMRSSSRGKRTDDYRPMLPADKAIGRRGMSLQGTILQVRLGDLGSFAAGKLLYVGD